MREQPHCGAKVTVLTMALLTMSDNAGVRLAYLGPPGTFGEQAALKYGPDNNRVPFPSHAAVIAAVAAGTADAGIIPVENSVEGAVNETLDLLIHEVELMICDELVLPVEQCLLLRPDESPDVVGVIFSHPQALGQCRRYIDQRFPGARLEASLSTAAAVESLMQTSGAAAIATQRAAEIYGATVYARAIQDRATNATRFVIVSHKDAQPTGHDKTSLAVGMDHDRPGTLVAVLGEFAREGINLTRIESRPSKDALGVYIFLIDLEGHRRNPKIAAVLERVRAQSNYFKVFGSYPRFVPKPDESGAPA
jgi:prephenate dehydratase